MKLRELLKRLDVVVRATPYLSIMVVPRDSDEYPEEWFEIGWDIDAEGSGPEFGYMPKDLPSWDPYIFYRIPDEGEDNPHQLKGVDVPWESEDWVIDKRSWENIVLGMEDLQKEFELLKARADERVQKSN